jgi:uncharacterized protein YndB with AHSA1/START domain
MAESRFVYEIYIRTTPEKLWQALTDGDFTRRYWFETRQDCAWKPGSPWRLMSADDRVADSGEVIECEPRKKLVLRWRHELTPELRAEGFSRMTYQIEKLEESVKLTVIHEIDIANSKLIAGFRDGWPMVLCSLKSLLETGESLLESRQWPDGM